MWPFLGSHPTSLSKVETLPSSQLEKVSSWFMSYSQWACKKLHSAFAFSCTFPLWAGRIGFSPSPFYAKNKKSNTMRQHRRRQYMAGTPGLPNLWMFWSAYSDFTMLWKVTTKSSNALINIANHTKLDFYRRTSSNCTLSMFSSLSFADRHVYIQLLVCGLSWWCTLCGIYSRSATFPEGC